MSGEEQQRARRKAMSLLEHMDRTEKGLREKLLGSGFSREAAEDAIEYVRSFGYIDDKRYAGNYIAGRIRSKSRRRIFQELMGKGISGELIQEAWDEESRITEPDEKAIIKKEIEKKCHGKTVLDEKEFRRLYGFLARRGFGSGDIRSVLEELQITVSFSGKEDCREMDPPF